MPTTLPEYASAVGELLLHLRDEGSVLSSMDQHLLASWWEAGYPLPVVLREVRAAGDKLLGRKRPPRGLPLTAMRKAVEKAGERALRLGAAGAPPEVDAAAQAGTLLGRATRSVASRRAAEPDPGTRGLLDAASEELVALDPDDPDTAFVALLGVSRRYYEALQAALPAAEAERLRGEALRSLGEAARRMAPDAREATVAELVRRTLRQRDPVLDPLFLEEQA